MAITSPQVVPIAEGQHQPDAGLADWLAVIAGAIGAFMATLDIAIVNTALPNIIGEIGASVHEGSWIATAYLVAEVIAIPLCGWLERAFGLRRFLLTFVVLFAAFSLLCGVADDLTTMIIGRAGQGFFGGALIPTALTIVARRLPLHRRALGTAIFGGTVILGPVVGPLLGGWITDTYGWRNIFLINLPIGVALCGLIAAGLPRDRSDWRQLIHADIAGVIGMSLGLGCLTALLEQGHAEDWFDSSLIWTLLIASIAGFCLVAVGQARAQTPVIDLRILRGRQFAAVFAISFMLGAGLYGTAFMIPQFLSHVAGDTALQAGGVVFVSGIPAIVLIPLIPWLLRHVDLRLGVAAGLIFMGLTCWLDSGLSSASGDNAFTVSQLARGVGQVLTMTFLNQAAINAVSPALAADASGLFNAARNLGGSFGLALLSTFQERRFDLHVWNIASSFDGYDPFASWVAATQDPGATIAATQQSIVREAMVLAFNDQFLMLAIALGIVVPLVLLLRRGNNGAIVHAH
ncbi:MAG: DHA2 family efflux MFS transporter permease subunit [Proteobacteria bacterium]|nr:DHA2 family efflux MFS transporter permease subunit [Pseudomonadota bacterium]